MREKKRVDLLFLYEIFIMHFGSSGSKPFIVDAGELISSGSKPSIVEAGELIRYNFQSSLQEPWVKAMIPVLM